MGELTNPTPDTCDTPKNLQDEHQKVTDLSKKDLKKGDTWYLLNSKWYEQWKKYVTNDGCAWDDQSDYASLYPGPINNVELFADNKREELQDNLVEDLQYKLIPEECWKMLVKHYGIYENQPAISRKVIEEGEFRETVIEIYLIPLKLCSHKDKEKIHIQKCSRVMTIDDLDKEMRSLFKVPANHDTKIWNAFINDNYEKMEKNQTIQKYSLQKNQLVVIEVKEPNGEWTLEDKKNGSVTLCNGSSVGSKSSSFGSSSPTSSYQLRNSSSSQSYAKKRNVPGLCGLNNLGNTCFMNSALQCLSNVPALTNYFKSGEYKSELNVNNPLGMGGKIAKNYANLIHMLWSGDNSSYPPREFKFAVGQFQSRFLGYSQQDSQELLAFLIDGLHEDLNRISKKPYIEAKDADGRPDDVVATEAWENHRKRNNSIIVDTLHGLYRSIVECPGCPRVSVTFDPFCFLTLPLPAKRERTLECTFVPLNTDKEMTRYKLTVPKSGIMKDLCKALSEYNHKPFANMVVTDVYNSSFHKVFQSSDQIRTIYDKDIIYVFESMRDATMVPVYMRHVSPSGSTPLFGLPLLVPVQPGQTTYIQLYKAILNGASRFIVNEELKNDIDAFLNESDDELQDLKASSISDINQEIEECSGKIFSLFVIKVVNTYGTSEYKQFEDRNQPIKLKDGIHLSADWSKTAFENHFTKEWTKSVVLHESLDPGATKKPHAEVNLMNCMELFTSKEQLGKDNTWYCSNCKKHQQAFKKFDLWMLPPVLIIHLKRFSHNRWARDKLDTFIDFPIRDLDLSDFVVNPLKDKLQRDKRCYNLIAVSNHYGGLGGGHYTAFAKNNLDKQWHYFDDSSVSFSNEDRVVTKAAYMLVYQRQDVEQWFHENHDKPFPFLEPIFSPRAMEVDSKTNQTSFEFSSDREDEDVLNNNNAEDMDVI